MRQAVEDPERGVVAVGQHVAVAHAVFNRHLVDGAVERRIHRRVGVVHTEPDDAADGVGQPVAALCYEGKACLYHFDTTLIEIRFAFVFPIQRVEAEGRAEGALLNLADLVEDGLLTLAQAAKKAKMTKEKFKAKVAALKKELQLT